MEICMYINYIYLWSFKACMRAYLTIFARVYVAETHHTSNFFIPNLIFKLIARQHGILIDSFSRALFSCFDGWM